MLGPLSYWPSRRSVKGQDVDMELVDEEYSLDTTAMVPSLSLPLSLASWEGESFKLIVFFSPDFGLLVCKRTLHVLPRPARTKTQEVYVGKLESQWPLGRYCYSSGLPHMANLLAKLEATKHCSCFWRPPSRRQMQSS